MDLIAHINLKAHQPVQSCEEHNKGVATLAESFASEFGFGKWGYAMGMLHDKGKEKIDFQNYIRKTSEYDVDVPSWNDKTHAYVGALLARRLYKHLGDLIINQIAGHHTGLYDYDTLESEIMTKEIPAEVSCDIDTLSLPIEQLRNYGESDINHLYRMLYSCLVDADFLDTERFMDYDSFNTRGNKTSMNELEQLLQHELDKFKNCEDTTVNKIRRKVQDECLKASSLPPGFFSLTVPTGGGKTISSIVWAVNHAMKNGKERIIIAIPYTSIIVQTAAVLKNIFGEENVLEHHSNIDYENNTKLNYRLKLATENWDYPIIVTTNVQLFESMYSNKPSACRKLHNICNSILILDEVQTLPTDFLQPIVDALKCYQKNFGVSVLFTTASQPILSGVRKNPNGKMLNGIEEGMIYPIIPEEFSLHKKLERVSLKFDDDVSNYDDIANRLTIHKVVLCIVNTRHDAVEIYKRLPKEGLTLHLSRLMYPLHISATLSIMKAALKEKYPTIRVVSTQLIEAGVDIDFPVVYRQIAGLDSILQAAGRCNREGKIEDGQLGESYVFSLTEQTAKGTIGKTISAMEELLLYDNLDFFSADAMYKYFNILYSNCDFDKKEIQKEIYVGNSEGKCKVNFQTIADKFKLIDDGGANTIIIENSENRKYLNEIKSGHFSYSTLKQLMKYSVSVSKWEFEKLKEDNIIIELCNNADIYIISGDKNYSSETGLLSENEYINETFII